MLDSTPPVFTVNPYQNPSSSATQNLTGTKEPGCIVKINGTPIFGSDDASPSWSYTVNLISGITNHFVFTAADALGNTTSKVVDILYDNAPPAPLGPGVLVANGSGKGHGASLCPGPPTRRRAMWLIMPFTSHPQPSPMLPR